MEVFGRKYSSFLNTRNRKLFQQAVPVTLKTGVEPTVMSMVVFRLVIAKVVFY